MWDTTDLAAPAPGLRLSLPETGLYATMFSPDGERLVAAGAGGRVFVWMLDTDLAREASCSAAGEGIPVVSDLTGADAPGAASVNITAVNHKQGFITTFGCGTLPTTSTLNPTAGSVVANSEIVATLDATFSCTYTSSGGDKLIDLTGWWIQP